MEGSLHQSCFWSLLTTSQRISKIPFQGLSTLGTHWAAEDNKAQDTRSTQHCWKMDQWLGEGYSWTSQKQWPHACPYPTNLKTLNTRERGNTRKEHLVYLEVMIDKRLIWKSYILDADKKANIKLSLMKKLTGTNCGANSNILKKVYKRSIIEYSMAPNWTSPFLPAACQELTGSSHCNKGLTRIKIPQEVWCSLETKRR